MTPPPSQREQNLGVLESPENTMHTIVKTARVAGGCLGELMSMAVSLGKAEGSVYLFKQLRIKYVIHTRV